MNSGSHLVADGSGKKHALPTIGYSELQTPRLSNDPSRCDTTIVASPVDLACLISLPKPYGRVRYNLDEVNHPDLAEVVSLFLRTFGHWPKRS
jgi:hypothetical protein